MIKINVQTKTETEMINMTSEIQSAVNEHNFKDGIVTVYSPHTTAGITINEGADPDVKEIC